MDYAADYQLMRDAAGDAERTLANSARFGTDVLPQVRALADTHMGI